ncbi:hypothetical protein J6590_058521 [Homalodisca vitripennis]|nr:hypothetical protein J6590_058521 [Homalodisca vitripennis]
MPRHDPWSLTSLVAKLSNDVVSAHISAPASPPHNGYCHLQQIGRTQKHFTRL